MKADLQKQKDMKKNFLDDVVETQHFFNNFAELKKGIIRLYKVWVLEECKESMVAKDSTRQYIMKRKQLETKYAALKTKQQTTSKNNKTQNKRIITENVYLIGEINTMQ